METIQITIDSRIIEAEPGMTILQAARRAGMGDRIPTLCYEPSLPPYTSCFVCVVEQEGVGKLLPACSTKVARGMVLHTRTERVTGSRKTALELLLSDHPADCVAPCKRGCPAGVDVQRYLALAKEGRYADAVKTIRDRNPFTIVCGRVCVRKCEDDCRRQIMDTPVGINMVKRAVSDWWKENPYEEVIAPATGKRIAVIGGGPSGLTAAYYLRKAGHEVKVFEMREKLGGMVRYGIPDYRLPQDLLDFEIGEILKLGVEVQTGVRIGTDLTLSGLRKEFNAVYIAVGAQKGSAAYIEGEDHPAVMTGVDFLIGVKNHVDFGFQGKKVAVIGGGNTAIDAARTALRLGASHVSILYRRTRKEMPANEEEIVAADEEGIRLEPLVAPLAVKVEGETFRGLICQRMELGEPDASGRRRPVPVPDSDHLIQCDVVLAAIGQKVDMKDLNDTGEDLAMTRWGSVAADEYSCATSMDGVFAGGDALLGPAVVIDAIAHGRRAALSIGQYLEVGKPARTLDVFSSRKENFGEIRKSDLPLASAAARAKQAELPHDERITHFDEVEMTLEDYQVRQETERCLSCGCAVAETCDLRRYAEEYGLGDQVRGQTTNYRLDVSHPSIVMDPNKCILCTRCVRTCGDVLGISVLGLVNRGFDTVISPSLGRPLASTDCISCGNCVDACPTGALHFKAIADSAVPRKETATPCVLCGEMCPAVLGTGPFGASLRPTEDQDGIRQLLCELGRKGNVEILQGDRITRPMVRRDGKLVPVTMEEALTAAIEGMSRVASGSGGASLLFSGGGDLSCEDGAALFSLAQAFEAQAGSLAVLASDAEICDLNTILGTTRSQVTYEELESSSCILVVGQDPIEKNPVAAARFRRAKRAGAVIIALTSAPTAITRLADVWLETRRGTASLALGWILGRLLRLQPEDAAELRELRSVLSGITDRRLALECGVTPGDAQEAVAFLAGTPGSVVGVYTLDARGERGHDGLKLLSEIVQVVGASRPGTGLLLASSIPNLEGLKAVGLVPSREARLKLAGDYLRSMLFQGAWLVREDPDANSELRAVLSNLDFLVVQDLFMTATAARADVVLPVASHLEVGGTFVRTDRRILRGEAATDPLAPGLSETVTQALEILGVDAPDLAGLLEPVLGNPGTHLAPPVFQAWEVPTPMVSLGQPVQGGVQSAAIHLARRLGR